MLTKSQAINLFGSAQELQAALGLSRTAIIMWKDKVPKVHELRIRYELKPEAFNKNGTLRKRAA